MAEKFDLPGAEIVGPAASDGSEQFPGAEEVQVREPGFFTSVRRGIAQQEMGQEATFAANASQRAAELDTRIAASTNDAERAALQLERENVMKSLGSNLSNIKNKAAEVQATLPGEPNYEAFQQTKTTGEALRAFASHPIDVTSGIVGESLGGMLKTSPLTIGAGIAGGALAGPVGAAGAMALTQGVSSTRQDYDSGMLELLTQAGVDINDPAAVQQYMASPAFKDAQAKKVRRALTVGAFDAAAAALSPLKLRPSAMGNIAAQAGVQMGAGGAGEAAGALAGAEEISPQAVLAEMIGELPGTAKEVGAAHLGSLMRGPLNERVATQKEKEAGFGLNDVQADAVAATQAAAPKPKLSPLQSQIFVQAAGVGLDPITALAIAGHESRFDPKAKNPDSTAYGLFQIVDGTWNGLGGGDRDDVNLQIARGLQNLAANNKEMTLKLGRELNTSEAYLGHLLGPQVATGIIRADGATPIAEALKAAGAKDIGTIVRANGMTGMTVEQARAKWADVMNKQLIALGANDRVNQQARAGKDADAAPNETELQDGLEDLDALFEEFERQKPTDEDLLASGKELDLEQVDPVAQMDAALLNEDVDPQYIKQPAEEALLAPERPTLSEDLAAAAPRYGFGSNLWPVEFENDVDKAAYIIANAATKSKRDADYLAFVQQHTGMTETEARAYGRDIRASVKEAAQAARGTDTPVLRVADGRAAEVGQIRADSGVSLDEARTRLRYPNPNDAFKENLGQAPILVADTAGVAGTKLGTYSIKPGEVVAAGVDSAQTPLAYMESARQTISDAVKRFAPSARVAVTFATEDTGSVSSYRNYKNIGVKNRQAAGRGLYRINLRNATNLGITDDGTRNSTTRMKILSATWHEIGHVVADEQMTRGMSPELKQKFMNMEVDGYFTPEELATLPAEQAAVLREYNDLKWRTLNDPGFTARDWAEAWLSPWKLAHGWGQGQGVESFTKRYMGEGAVQALDGPAKNLALTMQPTTNILSPHEYLAEQMSRYAYSRGLYEQSNLVQRFFAEALAKMREFFAQLKRGGNIKAGTAFAEWLDSLTNVAKDLGVNKALPQEPAPSATKPRVKVKAAKVTTPSITDTPSVLPERKTAPQEMAKVAVPEYSVDQLGNFQLLAGPLRYLAQTQPARYQHYMELVRANRLEDFYQEAMTTLPDELADRIRHDTDVPDTAPWAEYETTLPKISKEKSFVKGVLAGNWNLRRKIHFFTTMRQMAFAHPDVSGLQHIEMLMSNYKAFKNKLEFKGLEVNDRWSKLGKEQFGLLEQAMREEHASGEHLAEMQVVNGVMRFLPGERLASYAAQKGLDEDTVAVWLAAKNAHISHMNALQNVLRAKLADRYKGKPKTLQIRTYELGQMFDQIRARPFLPQTRFGEYAVHVLERGVDGGDAVRHVEFFESQKERDEALSSFRAALPENKFKVQPAQYQKTSAVLRTLPPELLLTYAGEFDLTAKERAELRQIADATTLNSQTRRYSAQLAAISGANKNLHRGFADFIWNSSNSIAKLHYKEHFERGIASIQSDMWDAADSGDVQQYDRLAGILRFSQQYVDHMMSPSDEFQSVRSLVVMKMLWGNIKSAVANAGSLKDLWSLAATQQGIGRGTVNVNSAAFKALTQNINSVMRRVLRQPTEGAQVWAADTQWALDQAKSDGLLDESYAAQLAKFAQGTVLSRAGLERTDRLYKQLLWYGMLPQHAVEKFVRQTSLVSQFEFYLRQGNSRTDAYQKARGDTYRLMGDNSLPNRPEFMRGKLSPFLIFYGFTQNQLYLLSGAQERARNLREALDSGATGDLTTAEARQKFYRVKAGGETVKMWLTWAALGGMMGVPGAEDLDNVLELVSKKFFGQRFSLKEHAFEVADYLSKNARALGLDIAPRSFVHGLGADFNLFGLLPSIDVSSSLQQGQVLGPISGGLEAAAAGDKDKFLQNSMGPLGQTLGQLAQVFSDDPSMLKKASFFMPNIASKMAQAWKGWEDGVRDPNGARITLDRRTGEVRDITTGEMLFQMMGFQSEIVSSNQEVHWMQKDAQKYWTTRRNMLMGQVYEARLLGDREAEADARESLQRFNESAPRQLRITGKELSQSIKAKRNAARKAERQQEGSRRFRAENRRVRELVLGDGQE